MKPSKSGWLIGGLVAASLMATAAGAHQITGTDIAMVAVLSVDYDHIDGAYELQYGELAALDERQAMDGDGDKVISPAERQAYLERMAADVARHLVLELDGEPLAVTVGEGEALPGQTTVTPGQMTLRFTLSAGPVDFTQPHRLVYRDLSEHPRLIHSDVSIEGLALADVDASDLEPVDGALKEVYFQAYGRGVEAAATLVPAAAAWGGLARGARTTEGTPTAGLAGQTNRLQEMLKQDKLSAQVVAVALVLALFLGAAHALEPGHGKTLVAAYLIGSRGTVANAMFLGLVVTLTHTLSVIILGVITLFASQYVLPEQIFPWLGAGSGLLILGLGAWLFVRTLKGGHAHFHFGGGHHHGPDGHSHSHEEDRGHSHEPEHGDSEHVLSHEHGDHEGHSHSHAHAHDHPVAAREAGHEHAHAAGEHEYPQESGGRVPLLTMLTLGITGGIIPCPGALVILLIAVGLHRIGLGLTLIVAFSLGLAAVLITIGILMVRARPLMERFTGEGKWIQRLPVVSSVVIMGVGIVMAVRALMEAGIVIINL